MGLGTRWLSARWFQASWSVGEPPQVFLQLHVLSAVTLQATVTVVAVTGLGRGWAWPWVHRPLC